METSIENSSEESDIANVFPTNGQWATNNQNNGSNSTLLFIAVEYVSKDGSSEFKFEPDANFSPQASTYSEFDQHVSPLDPNMSSAARYSPVYSDSVDNGYNNSVVVLQDGVNPLISTEICPNPEFVSAGTNTGYNHLTSPESPLDSISSTLSTADNNILRQVVTNSYLQMGCLVAAQNGEAIVDETRSNGSPVVDFNQTSPNDNQIIDKELQLVQFPVDTYTGLSMERNMKVDPDQVELLITDQNTGVSYSGYISQDFLVSRSTLPALPEDEQQLNQVLNTLENHGLVMETQQEEINGVGAVPQNGDLSIAESQMMLQDSLLDSDLLLQAPVEIALADSVLSNNALALKSSNAHNQLLETSQTGNQEQIIDDVSLDDVPTDLVICDEPNNMYKPENMMPNHIKIENFELDDQEIRRSKRKKNDFKEDSNFLNSVQTICDKPVPSRARATLPAIYLVINKLPIPNELDPEYGVIARKLIPKRTQFGPLEGILTDNLIKNEGNLQLLVETETGAMNRLDVSDENTSNWMRFVRPAKNYGEMNLVLSQQGHSLYYTTTRAILPRQELLVGYSAVYAAKRKLPNLQPNPNEELPWNCYECPSKFATSEEFQKHLNVHDEVVPKDEEPKIRVRKFGRFNKRRFSMACPYCTKTFFKKYSLNRHLLCHTNPGTYKDVQVKPMRKIQKNMITDKSLQWKCTICKLMFSNPSLHNIHELVHKNNDNVETITGLPLDLGSNCHEGEYLLQSGLVQCPECGSEFEQHNDLISHVTEHGQSYTETRFEPRKAFKCSLCYKAFANRDRLQHHMLVHGSDESKPLKCDICHKRFLNNSALTCHLKTHKRGKKIFECPICKECYDQVFLLKDHVRIHCINGTYSCPHCNKIFKEYSVIRKHIRAFHCDRKHGCPYCSKPFPTLDKLRMHLLKHSDHREFLCADCGKQFKRKDKLKEHMKRMHAADKEVKYPGLKIITNIKPNSAKKTFLPKVQPTDYHRFIYKCHTCLLGFKRRGMLVNHLAKRHPDISPESVPELNLPILKTTRDYYCQYCDKVYKSSSKRKAHILKNHPGLELPMSNRRKGGVPEVPGEPNPTFSQTVGSITTSPHACPWCHKQYASKAKLLQHQRKKHTELMPKLEKRGKSQQKLPASPAIPEDSKYVQSPDVPDDLGAVGSSGIIDETDVTEDQLTALSNGGFIHCDDSKVIFDNSSTKYKLQDDNLQVEEYIDRTNGQYYRIIEMPSDQVTLSSESSVDQPESSRLYRLLTTNGPFPPYPPR